MANIDISLDHAFEAFENCHNLGTGPLDYLHPMVCNSKCWTPIEVFVYLQRHIAFIQSEQVFVVKKRPLDNPYADAEFSLTSRKDVHTILECFVFPQYPPGENEEAKPPIKGTAYLTTPMRLSYGVAVFDPADPDPKTRIRKPSYLNTRNRAFNMFTGFRFRYNPEFEVDTELLSPYLDHAKHIICDGNEEVYEFLIQWLAHLVQVPDVKPQSALLLRSPEGTGKDLFFKGIRNMIGERHVGVVENEDRLNTRFNEGITFKLLIVCNEVTYGKSHKVPNHLKTLITDDIMTYERKNVNAFSVKSCERYVLLSNEEHPVPISESDRRYACLEVSTARLGDVNYYANLAALCDPHSPMLEHLYHFLMNTELKSRNRIPPPITNLKRKLQTLTRPVSDEFQFLHDMASREGRCEDWEDFDGRFLTSGGFTYLYRLWADNSGKDRKRIDKEVFGRTLKAVLGERKSAPRGLLVGMSENGPAELAPTSKAYLVDYSRMSACVNGKTH